MPDLLAGRPSPSTEHNAGAYDAEGVSTYAAVATILSQGDAAGMAADGMVSLMTRCLGERRKYGAYRDTLAHAVHYDAHLLQHYAEESSFRFDGLGSSWLIQLGRCSEGSDLFPRRGQVEEMDAHDQRARDLRCLLDAIEHLREYDPMLHQTVFRVCMAGGATIMPGRGTRHQGDVWGRVLKETYGGDDGRLWRHLQAGWGLVAILVVEAPVLAAAQEAEAVDLKALRWARERELI